MRRSMIVSGGERGRRISAGGPALGVTGRGPGSVRRRSGRRPTEFLHAVDWGYVGFVLAVAATAFVLVFVAMEPKA